MVKPIDWRRTQRLPAPGRAAPLLTLAANADLLIAELNALFYNMTEGNDTLARQILKHKETFEARRHDQSGKHQVAE